jgi:hypothetical protein
MCTKFWPEILKGRDHLADVGVDGRIIFEWILEKLDGKVWTGYIWLMTGISGGVL